MDNLPAKSLIKLKLVKKKSNYKKNKYHLRVENLNSAKVNFNLISTSDLLRSARHHQGQPEQLYVQ